jgi:hypothetical protein
VQDPDSNPIPKKSWTKGGKGSKNNGEVFVYSDYMSKMPQTGH